MLPRSLFRRWMTVSLSLAVMAPAAALAQGIESPRIPLRTSLAQIATLRSDYADAYTRKDIAEITAAYAPDAIMLGPDGSMVTGRAAIGEAMKSGKWAKGFTIESDTVRVNGGTAWDVGTIHSTGEDGKAQTMRYLVVLRRGMNGWQVAASAVTPMMAKP